MARQLSSDLSLDSRWVGALPLVNALIDRLQIRRLFTNALPATNGRTRLSCADALLVLLKSLVLNQRHPLYTLSEWAREADPSLLGLASPQAASSLNDDRVGRALDALFQADRASLLTQFVVHAVREFKIELKQLHNDSTTVTLQGKYAGADGHTERGHKTVRAAHGHNKDHRPDLKQLLFVLTVSADGAVPVHFRALDGNTNDSSTHIESWNTLRELAGKASFLYVADCKLCSKESLAHIDSNGGRFVTVLPRNRREDGWFREFVQKNVPPWDVAVRRPHPRRRDGPEDVWRVVEAALPSKEGYRVIWVWNTLMAIADEESRQSRIEKAWAAFEHLSTKLAGKRCRLRERLAVEKAAEKILADAGATRWLEFVIEEEELKVFRQEKRGRPSDDTRYLRRKRLRFTVSLRRKQDVIEADARSDGMFPLLTNDKKLTPTQVLEAYKFQPRLERRFTELKSVQDVAPVWLKSIRRIEPLLFLYFVSLLVQALLEREVRRAMARGGIETLPLYPEERECRAPSSERILDLFAPLRRTRLYERAKLRKTFDPELTKLQKDVLRLLGMDKTAFETVA
jgi:transposase